MNSPENAKTLGTMELKDGNLPESEGSAERIRRLETDEPLRRRILAALAEKPRTPSELAALFEVRQETVSRKLKLLRDEGLAQSRPVEGDGRRRQYEPTEEILVAGGIELSRHRAYGEPVQPIEAPPEEELAFLEVAMEEAVELRRQSNELDVAEERLRIVLREAEKRDAKELIVEATAELITTLRQNKKLDEVPDLIADLEAFGAGEVEESPALVLPALAHREYALGRLSRSNSAELKESSAHLIGAAKLYEQLVHKPHYLQAEKWNERLAWSIASHADNLRARSDYDTAFLRAREALEVFDEIDDSYGRTHSYFLLGFCLRLIGDFNSAQGCLNEAMTLATTHSYERFRANALMQLGEVMRCKGELGEARSALEQACEHSRRLGLGVTAAFALSALGAVAFDEDEYHRAAESFAHAQEAFARHQNGTGLALVRRRHAAAIRMLLQEQEDLVSGAETVLAQALDQYRALNSPAGIVSCQIEQGRLGLLRGQDASATVSLLVDLLDNRTSDRNMIELDPWVPRVLNAFAEETGDGALIERAKRCLRAADLRFRRGADLIKRVVGERSAASEPRSRVDEMGGETRQQQEVRELAAV
jgi:DNA-binding transcriptional ArsR family regulator